ncbi:hypothetical protein ACHQM5_000159 [Ranunculus cassubicifolius]
MGNCSLKGGGVAENVENPVRVMTDSGGILEFKPPVEVQNVLHSYSGYGVYRKGHMSSPLSHHEQLFSGESYFLLPLKKEEKIEQASPRLSDGRSRRLRIKPTEPALEVLPSSGNGVWKMKLVIDTKQLEEILSEQVNIGELIEKMRTMAKSESSTPRRSKMYPMWAVGWKKTNFSSMFKVSPSRGNFSSDTDL